MVEFHGVEIPEGKLAEICRRYQVKELSLFGSILRDDFDEQSDIDVLVEFEPEVGLGLFEFLDLKYELEALLGRKVDLGSKDSLKPLIREPVLRRARVLYAA